MSFIVSDEHKNKIIALIKALLPEAKIYLFGSRARGTNAQWSDIDLALDNPQPVPRVQIGEINDIMAATNLPYKVDIVDLNKVSDLMKQAIERDKVLWEN